MSNSRRLQLRGSGGLEPRFPNTRWDDCISVRMRGVKRHKKSHHGGIDFDKPGTFVSTVHREPFRCRDDLLAYCVSRERVLAFAVFPHALLNIGPSRSLNDLCNFERCIRDKSPHSANSLLCEAPASCFNCESETGVLYASRAEKYPSNPIRIIPAWEGFRHSPFSGALCAWPSYFATQ